MPATFPGCAEFRCPDYTSRAYCADCEAERERERREAPHRKVYTLPAWKATRMEAFVRDDFTCVEPGCGYRDETETGKQLHGDHEPDVVDLIERGLSPFDVEHVV